MMKRLMDLLFERAPRSCSGRVENRVCLLDFARSIMLCSFLVLVLASETAFALNVQRATPNIGFTGTFNVFGARTLEKNHFSAGFMLDFTRHPLEFHNFTTGSRERGIVDYLVTTDFIGEYGIVDRFTVGLDVPLQVSNHLLLSDMTQSKTGTCIGDITVYGKFAILHPDLYPVGLAVMPYVIVPTGSSSDFVGDASVDIGLKLALDKEFSGGYLGLNVGFKGRLKEDKVVVTGSTASLDVASELTYGLGGGVDIIGKKLQFLAELTGSSVLKDFAEQKSSPIEINGGIRSRVLKSQLALYLGGGGGLNAGYGSPQFRVFGGATYHFPAHLEETVKAKEVVVPKFETIILQGVTFVTASAELTENSKKILDDNYVKLQKFPKEHFIVVGHTDYRGSDEYNMDLSQRRAKSVADYFVAKGIPADRITSEGHGESEPIAPNDTAANMELNRRVEVRVIR